MRFLIALVAVLALTAFSCPDVLPDKEDEQAQPESVE